MEANVLKLNKVPPFARKPVNINVSFNRIYFEFIIYVYIQ